MSCCLVIQLDNLSVILAGYPWHYVDGFDYIPCATNYSIFMNKIRNIDNLSFIVDRNILKAVAQAKCQSQGSAILSAGNYLTKINQNNSTVLPRLLLPLK